MNVLCPACRGAVAVAVGDPRLRCGQCGLDAALSAVGTAPGVALALAQDRTGARLGRYRLDARLGSGGMGTVYRAHAEGDAAAGTSPPAVAIKVLHPELAAIAGGDGAARVAREAEALRRLEHPGLARLLEVGDDDGTPYLVTELVEGHDLAAHLRQHGPLPVAAAAALLAEVCHAVAAAHQAGIVHRDLKPANLVRGDDGRVRVVDFGLARIDAPQLTTLTRTDLALGTLYYLAPEQRRDARAVDGRADVYALGVIFYELITGELPLGRFALPGARGLDPRADRVIEAALAPDPAARTPSAEALAQALTALTRPPARRRTLAAAAALLGLGALLAVGAVTLTSQRGAGPAPTPAPAPIARSGAAPPVDVAPIDAAPGDAPGDATPSDAPIDAALPIDAAPTVDARPRRSTTPVGKREGKRKTGKPGKAPDP